MGAFAQTCSIGVLSANLLRGYPEVVHCRWSVAEIRNSKIHATQDLDRFRPLNNLIPYIIFGLLYIVSCASMLYNHLESSNLEKKSTIGCSLLAPES